MKFRNHLRLADGRIDCELNHPDYGWIPFTAAPDDVNATGREIFAELDAIPDLPVAPPQDPGDFKAAAIAVINDAAGAIRARYITDLPGQDMIYMAKEREARAFLADPKADPAAFPLLAAEVGITAPTAEALAQLWVAMADGWIQVAALIEAARLGAIAAIGAAETPEAAGAAVDAFRAVTAPL